MTAVFSLNTLSQFPNCAEKGAIVKTAVFSCGGPHSNQKNNRFLNGLRSVCQSLKNFMYDEAYKRRMTKLYVQVYTFKSN